MLISRIQYTFTACLLEFKTHGGDENIYYVARRMGVQYEASQANSAAALRVQPSVDFILSEISVLLHAYAKAINDATAPMHGMNVPLLAPVTLSHNGPSSGGDDGDSRFENIEETTEVLAILSAGVDEWGAILFNNRRLIAQLLIGIAKILIVSQQFDKARYCLELAWGVLHMMDKTMAESITDLSIGTGAYREVHGGKSRIDEFKRIDLLKRVPALAGWLLLDGCGSSFDSQDASCQADVLCELSNLTYFEMNQALVQAIHDPVSPDFARGIAAEDTAKVFELCHIALSLQPDHVGTLLSLARYEFDAYQSFRVKQSVSVRACQGEYSVAAHSSLLSPFDKTTDESSFSVVPLLDSSWMSVLVRAQDLVQRALRQSVRNASAW
jgi:hypothetical protein